MIGRLDGSIMVGGCSSIISIGFGCSDDGRGGGGGGLVSGIFILRGSFEFVGGLIRMIIGCDVFNVPKSIRVGSLDLVDGARKLLLLLFVLIKSRLFTRITTPLGCGCVS